VLLQGRLFPRRTLSLREEVIGCFAGDSGRPATGLSEQVEVVAHWVYGVFNFFFPLDQASRKVFARHGDSQC